MPLFKNVRPCTFLNYEFFYRKTRFYLETLTSCQQQRCFLLKNLSSTDVQGCTFFIRDGSHRLCELSVPPRTAVVPRNSDVLAGGAYQNSRPRIDKDVNSWTWPHASPDCCYCCPGCCCPDRHERRYSHHSSSCHRV